MKINKGNFTFPTHILAKKLDTHPQVTQFLEGGVPTMTKREIYS